MKKYLISIFFLFSVSSIFSQKNSIEIGLSTFNHFDGFGFKVTESIDVKPYPLLLRLIETMYCSIERQINYKNSIALSYNGFAYTYEKNRPSYRGLIARQFTNVNLKYKKKCWVVWGSHLDINAQCGISWRFRGGESFLTGYYNPYEPMGYGTRMFDFGPLIGMSARLKVFKGLFLNTQTNFTSYLVGPDLWKVYYSYIRTNKNVLSATLSIGYSF